MFNKLLVANRGEIAVRVIQACREAGISTVALYTRSEAGALHACLADECVLLDSPAGFSDQGAILRIAEHQKADAIHPGYGFLAERPDFALACEERGIAFIGPPADVMEPLFCKLKTLERVNQAGFPTVLFSASSFPGMENAADLYYEVDRLGYPVVIKACHGGRGLGEHLVRTPDRLENAIRLAQAAAQAAFGDPRIYLEHAIYPFHQIGVQVIGDRYGQLIHLGERESLFLSGNRKLIEESPAPSLEPQQRERLWQTALEIARLFNYQNVGSIEFLVDSAGRFYFTEIKARIQLEHPLTEMVARVDLVSEQIRIAAGKPMTYRQADLRLHGWAMLSRIRAEDTWRRLLPSPGILQSVRLPAGPDTRIDTYLYAGCSIPAEYDPLIAKLTVWGEDRKTCRGRMRRALEEFLLVGVPTNIPLIQQILSTAGFTGGRYNKEFSIQQTEIDPPNKNSLQELKQELKQDLRQDLKRDLTRDLAVAAAILYAYRSQVTHPDDRERTPVGRQRKIRRWRT